MSSGSDTETDFEITNSFASDDEYEETNGDQQSKADDMFTITPKQVPEVQQPPLEAIRSVSQEMDSLNIYLSSVFSSFNDSISQISIQPHAKLQSQPYPQLEQPITLPTFDNNPLALPNVETISPVRSSSNFYDEQSLPLKTVNNSLGFSYLAGQGTSAADKRVINLDRVEGLYEAGRSIRSPMTQKAAPLPPLPTGTPRNRPSISVVKEMRSPKSSTILVSPRGSNPGTPGSRRRYRTSTFT